MKPDLEFEIIKLGKAQEAQHKELKNVLERVLQTLAKPVDSSNTNVLIAAVETSLQEIKQLRIEESLETSVEKELTVQIQKLSELKSWEFDIIRNNQGFIERIIANQRTA